MTTPEHPDPREGRRRLTRSAVGVGLALVAVLAASLVALWAAPLDGEERYLDDLERQGLGQDFGSDEDAVQAARQRCEELDERGETTGTELERLGVERLCPQHADGFHTRDTLKVDGALLVMSLGEGSVDTSGGSCVGTDGYEDVTAETPVVVTDAEGSELARTTLGPGEPLDEDSCVFGFTVELTEGADRYEVVIGERGGRTLSWQDLHKRHALSFVLGGVD